MSNDRISAWTDDELTAHELDGLTDAFVKDQAGFIQEAQLYGLIGAAMRKEISAYEIKATVPLKALHDRLAEEPTVRLPWWRMMKFPLRDMGHSLRANWMPVAAACCV